MSKNLFSLVNTIDDQLASLEKSSNISEKIQKSEHLLSQIKEGLDNVERLKKVMEESDKHSKLPSNIEALLKFTDDIEAFEIIKSIVMEKKDSFNEKDNIETSIEEYLHQHAMTEWCLKYLKEHKMNIIHS